MPLVALDITVENRNRIKGMRGRWPAVRKSALQQTATAWHRDIMPMHFRRNNAAKYHHSPRHALYRKLKRLGAKLDDGSTPIERFVDNKLTGKSERAAKHLARISATGNKATVTMRMPAHFVRPFKGTVRGPNGKSRVIRKQPDKVAELLTVTEEDRRILRREARREMLLRVRLGIRNAGGPGFSLSR